MMYGLPFKSEYELDIKINKSKVDILVQDKVFDKNKFSFVKATQQYKSGQHPLLVNICNISRIFLAAIRDDISDSISWNDCLLKKNLEKCDVQICKLIIESKSTTTIIDNPPVPSSSYPVLESLNIELSHLESNSLHVIKLKNI